MKGRLPTSLRPRHSSVPEEVLLQGDIIPDTHLLSSEDAGALCMAVRHRHQIATTTMCLCLANLEEHSVWWISERALEAFVRLSLCLCR